jgi:5-methylcytosine-specific restriction enzyme subunit McrC
VPHITLQEWETKAAHQHGIADADLVLDSEADRVIRSLEESDQLEVLRLRSGICVRSTSWVGQLTIGNMMVSVRPKILGMPLAQLLRYVYSLRNLHILEHANHPVEAYAFQDLLVTQLASEVGDLLAKGLHRNYLRSSARLASPRGRIDFSKLASGLASASASIDCVYHDRDQDVLLNRVVLSGLHLALSIARDSVIREQVSRLVQILGSGITPLKLTARTFVDAQRSIDRRTTAYSAAVTIIELLSAGSGSKVGESGRSIKLPGFLFDMNTFFQALVSRFLRTELQGYSVQDERGLTGLFRYDPARNPLSRRSMAPRPDFSVMSDSRVIALLDAKYRDLWETSLPRDMLYQLAIYALSQRERETRMSIILYPAMDAAATDQAVQFRDPVRGHSRAEVVLRPVHLPTLATLVSRQTDPGAARRRREMARQWVFGERAESH